MLRSALAADADPLTDESPADKNPAGGYLRRGFGRLTCDFAVIGRARSEVSGSRT